MAAGKKGGGKKGGKGGQKGGGKKAHKSGKTKAPRKPQVPKFARKAKSGNKKKEKGSFSGSTDFYQQRTASHVQRYAPVSETLDFGSDNLSAKAQKVREQLQIKMSQRGAVKRVLNAQEKQMLKMSSATGAVLKLWEKFRRNDCPKEDRLKYIHEALQRKPIAEHYTERDIARVYCTAIKWGNQEIHREFWAVFKGKAVDVASGVFTTHLMECLLNYAPKDVRKEIVLELLPASAKLFTHKVGLKILSLLYSRMHNWLGSQPITAQRKIILNILRETPGLVPASEDLKLWPDEIWAKHPDLEMPTIENLGKMLMRCITKGLVDELIVHRMMFFYLKHGLHEIMADMLADIKPALIHMCNTPYGAKVAIQFIQLADEMDREEILRTFQRSVVQMTKFVPGAATICRIFDIVDDTDIVEDIVITELKLRLREILLDERASRVIIHLLTPSIERKRALLPESMIDYGLWSEGQQWETLQVKDLNTDQQQIVTETITVGRINPTDKHAVYLSSLVPEIVKVSRGKDLDSFCKNPHARAILEELIAFIRAKRLGIAVDEAWIGEVESRLKAVPVAERQRKRTAEGDAANEAAEEEAQETSAKPAKRRRLETEKTETERPPIVSRQAKIEALKDLSEKAKLSQRQKRRKELKKNKDVPAEIELEDTPEPEPEPEVKEVKGEKKKLKKKKSSKA
eukprot:TRINITY_DN3402_c0_g1_i1.p1 TRINITY_DN3402_c0_g1~~TRINITY_DN3402_c0_g1_i1.p1  ORF type:complete len:695 (+),score=154.32 TRINITY_DN3402_c0_g1_i1:27-2087(+)